MHKLFTLTAVLAICLSTSSCFYYKSMPKDWREQVSEAENISMFNGRYELTNDNKSLSDEEKYNDLRYFQNTIIYGLQRIYIPGLTSVDICTTNGEVHIALFSGKELVHETHFKKRSVEFKNGILTLDLKNQLYGGGLCMAYEAPKITLYNTTNNEIVVRQRQTLIGTAIIIPITGGQNYWFKLKRIE